MDLISNLWRYAVRYSGWMALSVVATVAYATTTAVMVSLIEPIFAEVLPAGSEMATAVPLLSAAPDASAELAEAAEGSSPAFFNLYAQLRRFYEGLKTFLGIEPDQVLFFVPALFFVVYLLRMIAAFLSSYAFQHAGLGVTTDLRNALCEQILRQSSRFHAEHTSGELYSRVVSDVDKMQGAVSSRLLDLLQQSLTLVGLLALLLSTHLRLALTCLMAAPLILYPIVRFGRGMRKNSHRSQERMADLSSLLTEVVRGHRIVKAFGMEDFELGRFREATRQHLKVNLRIQILSSYSSPVVESLATLGGCGLLIYFGLLIREGELTTALFSQFLANLLLLYDPIRRLNKVNLVLQAALAAARRVFDLLAISNDIEDPAVPRPLATIERGLSFNHVSFGYRDAYVLKDFNLQVEVGQRIALVGPSGAGKSTVVNLLPRFFDPAEGSVRIDGIDIREVSLKDLRSLIGLVSQETVLFNDTVFNNLAYGRREIPLERVREAAAASYADEFIMEMPQGFDSIVGESGQHLSGGERQRLAIARALLKDAPILILDEATSQLDSESEHAVQKALSNLMQGRTTIVIAHRLSTVMSADLIVVMDAGRIVERGSHQELLAMGGLYRRLYDLQFKV